MVEHIGSTAVPGLSAKPVLDVLLAAATLGQIEQHIDALVGAGYEYRHRYERQIPDRRYFVRAADGAGALRVHLHAVVQGGMIWRNHLIFRDALRADPALRDAYEVIMSSWR